MESFVTTVMTSHGYLALIILAFVEACCIPISSEVTFALAGMIAATHPNKFSLVAVIVIGTLAEMGGSLTSYAVGRRGGRHLLERYGKWVLVSGSDLDRAERLFSGRGAWVVAVARVLPLVRCFASFSAGVVEVPAVPFTIFSFIGTAIWATALSVLGYEVGPTVKHLFHSFSIISVILAVVLIAGLIAHRVHAIRKDAHRAQPDGPATETVAAETVAAETVPAAGTENGKTGTDGSGSARLGTGRPPGAHRSGRGPGQ